MFLSNRRSFLAGCLAALPVGLSSKLQFLAGREADSLTGLKNFAFLHLSDSHLEPRHEGQSFDENSRSLKTLGWLGRQTANPVEQPPYNVNADKPAFAIHTGDVFEYSESDHAWDDWDKVTADFECPLYLIPGNHDNAWGEINRVMTKRFGGQNYSFDHGGCHFICINSAGLLEPMPSLDRAMLNWLAEDLKMTPEEVPLFLSLHHPLNAVGDYASAFDSLRLWDIVCDRRIVLIMDGHWHIVQCNKWQHFDRINGGATFGPHTGYNSITIENGILRVMFQYEHESPEGEKLVPLLEKSLDTLPRTPVVQIEVDAQDSANGQITILAAGVPNSAMAEVWADIDASQAQPLMANDGVHRGTVKVDALVPGWHFVTVRVKESAGQETTYGKAFCVKGTNNLHLDVRDLQLRAGVKARPIAYKDWMLVGNTLGEVIALSHDLQQQWKFDAGAQVVHSVAVHRDRVLMGDISGRLRMLSAEDGQLVWECQLPRAIYAAAACDELHAYVGDSHGGMHAVRLTNGEVVWSTRPAMHAIEAQATLVDDQILIGSWDAFIYSLDLRTGETRWKSRCPSGHLQSPARYYATADCPLLVIGNKIFACDRGYRLGRYSSEGQFERQVAQNISAIGLDSSGKYLLGKGLKNRLFKFNRQGRRVWRVPTTGGRIVTAPVEHEGRIAVLSDKGIVSLHKAADGQFISSYSVSPSLYCLSGLGLDSSGGLFTADMDGRLTRLMV